MTIASPPPYYIDTHVVVSHVSLHELTGFRPVDPLKAICQRVEQARERQRRGNLRPCPAATPLFRPKDDTVEYAVANGPVTTAQVRIGVPAGGHREGTI